MSKILQLNENTYVNLETICTLKINRQDFFNRNILTINGVEISCTNQERDIFLDYFRGDIPILDGGKIPCLK